MHVFVFYFLVYMLFSYSAFRLQECSIKSVSHISSSSWNPVPGSLEEQYKLPVGPGSHGRPWANVAYVRGQRSTNF